MSLQEQLTTIKNKVQEFFEKTTIEVEVREVKAEENVLKIDIDAKDPQILIGENGQTLAEIQHLLKLVLRRVLGENFFLDIDINGYKKKKIAYLEQLAKDLADEVSLTKAEKELLPMPAFDRRIIHLALSQRQDVKTESLGQEPGRRVVIKPV